MERRQSLRERTPTMRARHFMARKAGFPDVGDDIKVKWIVDSRPVWWPASVISINDCSPGDRKCGGELSYVKLGDYAPAQTPVVFTITGTNQRFVRSVDGSSSTEGSTSSSWIYADEDASSDEDTGSPSVLDKTPPQNHRHSLQGASASSSGNSSVHKATRNRSSHRPRSRSGITKSTTTKLNLKRLSASMGGSLDEGSAQAVEGSSKNTVDRTEQRSPQPSSELDDVRIRLRLIERHLEDVKPSNRSASSLTTTTRSVIVSLRWAFLKTLEKPLKLPHNSAVSQHGIEQHELSVSVHCDYHTFREIAAVLAKEQYCVPDNPSDSRVAFSPSFNTTQSGSTASDNLSILFSSLSDLTSFLYIRDDNDFEKVLSKELVTETSTLLRVLGTFVLEDSRNNYQQARTEYTAMTKSTASVCESSENSQTISIFVGTAPLSFVTSDKPDAVNVGSSSDPSVFKSTLFQQQCKHYCRSKKCFQSPWNSKHVDLSYTVNSTFHLDGTVAAGEIEKYFVLNWKRQAAPSSSKWTRDVQDFADNAPGVLRLSIPFVFSSTNRNVRSLIALLDKHIETFMKVRSSMHSQSSFK